MEKVHDSTKQNAFKPPQHPYNFIGDDAVSAIRDGLELLLHGQQKIGSRLDCLQQEQVKSKQELEGDLMNIMDELKGDIAGKSFEQSVELEKVKVNQEHLHNELNIVNLRLEEMERLVSNLLQENKDEDILKLTEIEKPEHAEEITKSDSLQSVLSISSGSNVEEQCNQQKRSRKPSHALIFSQSVDDPKSVVEKAETMEITRL
ncbi:hypothetical protein ANCDUO_00039 [Ancylostoma duodenale]|uniref:Uncharacterized protein n=1 Tax=Ancylostoma duodenale TaxID=51022 RepID=A0A0C2HJ54_9BILA|nr:hypothetical protein ANCDUO_00039 [Ancylostoma duodenale]